MYISLNNRCNNVGLPVNPDYGNRVKAAGVNQRGSLAPLSRDCVSFCGKAKKKDIPSIEEHIKDMHNVHDPYSDVVMISKSKFKRIKELLGTSESAKDMINVLNSCKQHMFPEGEAKVYDILISDAEKLSKTKKYKHKDVTFSDILTERLSESKQNLIDQQKAVIDRMRSYGSENFDKAEKALLNEKLQVIESEIAKDTFRIKPSVGLLRELYGEIGDSKKVDKLIEMTEAFPNCATSADAFIVKNAQKSSKDIAEALLSPAQASVEHVRPQSIGGESVGGNYIAASKRMNNLRGSMSYKEFIQKFPNIPECTQKYFDDIIKKVNGSQIPDVAAYIFDVKDTLKKESEGLIDVHIKLDDSILEKLNKFAGELSKLVSHFNIKK